jgi:hypothetical protein
MAGVSLFRVPFPFLTSDLNHHVAVLELQNRGDESSRTSMVKFNFRSIHFISRRRLKMVAFSGLISKDLGVDTLPWTHRSFTTRMCACFT